MQVIALSGSPIKGGNTETAIQAVLEGARAAGAETELVRLYGLDIAPCDACNACQSGQGCVISDPAAPLLERLERAQAIVFGSPVYWFAVSGPMKTLVDRTYYAAHHKQLAGKRLAVILVQQDSGADCAQGLFDCFADEHKCDLLEPIVVTTADRRDMVAGDAALLERLRELGRRLVG